MISISKIPMAPNLEQSVDLGHMLKLIALHGSAEAVTGAILFFEERSCKDSNLAGKPGTVQT